MNRYANKPWTYQAKDPRLYPYSDTDKLCTWLRKQWDEYWFKYGVHRTGDSCGLDATADCDSASIIYQGSI